MTNKQKEGKILSLIERYQYNNLHLPQKLHKVYEGEALVLDAKIKKAYNVLLESISIVREIMRLSGCEKSATPKGYVEVGEIINLVCEKFGLSVSQLKQHTRKAPLPDIRAVCAGMILANSEYSLKDVSEMLSNEKPHLDHTSVIAYKKKYFMLLKEGKQAARIIGEVEEELGLSNYNIGRLLRKKKDK
jgi:hypothetical protein